MVIKSTPVVLVLLVSMAAFLGGYFISHYSYSPDQKTDANIFGRFKSSSTINSPVQRALTLDPLSQRKIMAIGPSTGPNQIILYEQGGAIFNLNIKTGEEHVLSAEAKPGLSSILISPDGKYSLEFYGSQEVTKQVILRSLDNDSIVNLNEDIESAAFSPKGTDLAYFIGPSATEKNGSGIFALKIGNLSTQKIFSTRSSGLKLFWPKDGQIFFSIQSGTDVKLFSLSPQGDTRIVDTISNSVVLRWSPDGSKLLEYGQLKDIPFVFSLIDLDSEKKINFPHSSYYYECSWESTTNDIICFMGKDTNQTNGKIVRINTLAQSESDISPVISIIRPSDIFIPAPGSFISILNSYDNKLYVLPNK